jgi:hypothetical protein
MLQVLDSFRLGQSATPSLVCFVASVAILALGLTRVQTLFESVTQGDLECGPIR